mgnify:FL=1
MKFYNTFFILLLLSSCGNYSGSEDLINDTICKVLVHYGKTDANTVYLKLSRAVTMDKIVFTYKPLFDSTRVKANYILQISREQDSIIFIDKDTCILRGSKNFYKRNRTYKIKKYYYDDPNAYDVNCFYYINDTLGFVLIESACRVGYSTYAWDTGTIGVFRIEELDTSTFLCNKKTKQ